jgi:hypothetical protein
MAAVHPGLFKRRAELKIPQFMGVWTFFVGAAPGLFWMKCLKYNHWAKGPHEKGPEGGTFRASSRRRG